MREQQGEPPEEEEEEREHGQQGPLPTTPRITLPEPQSSLGEATDMEAPFQEMQGSPQQEIPTGPGPGEKRAARRTRARKQATTRKKATTRKPAARKRAM